MFFRFAHTLNFWIGFNGVPESDKTGMIIYGNSYNIIFIITQINGILKSCIPGKNNPRHQGKNRNDKLKGKQNF